MRHFNFKPLLVQQAAGISEEAFEQDVARIRYVMAENSYTISDADIVSAWVAACAVQYNAVWRSPLTLPYDRVLKYIGAFIRSN